MIMGVSSIYNFIEISDTVATAGQPTAAQFQDAQKAGYEVVVNLAPDGLQTSLPEEKAMLHELGLEYYHIPVPWDNPTLVQLAHFEQVMESVEGRRTLVHCQANYRVTAFYAAYAMHKLGWSQDKADAFIDRIWASRPDFEMDDTWKRFLADARQRS
jgi:protein tyrosine phosphatase (PTP) superfamily phosphohydrolase (DUF442 family)